MKSGVKGFALLSLFLTVGLLSACADTPLPPSVARGPHGHPTYFIKEPNKFIAFNAASRACARGYYIIDNTEMSTADGEYTMTIECR